jgi:hypothetical protein
MQPNRELYPQDSKSNWAWQLGLGALPKAIGCQTVSQQENGNSA